MPEADFVGYGGPKMQRSRRGAALSLVNLAVMWFLNVFLNIITFIRLIIRADRYFRDHKPDAVILIDYPGLHWWIAKRAKARGVPVFYYVPPQLWAWAGWRVKKIQRTSWTSCFAACRSSPPGTAPAASPRWNMLATLTSTSSTSASSTRIFCLR